MSSELDPNCANEQSAPSSVFDIPLKLSFPVIKIDTIEVGRAELVVEAAAQRVGNPVPSTGQHAVPPRSDVLRRVDIGVFGMATGPAAEYCLCWPVVRADVPTGRTGLAGVGRRHLHQPAALPH